MKGGRGEYREVDEAVADLEKMVLAGGVPRGVQRRLVERDARSCSSRTPSSTSRASRASRAAARQRDARRRGRLGPPVADDARVVRRASSSASQIELIQGSYDITELARGPQEACYRGGAGEAGVARPCSSSPTRRSSRRVRRGHQQHPQLGRGAQPVRRRRWTSHLLATSAARRGARHPLTGKDDALAHSSSRACARTCTSCSQCRPSARPSACAAACSPR